MRICIDSNQFIFGLSGSDPASEDLLRLLPHLDVVIPRLVLKEVTRNLNQAQIRSLYALLHQAPKTVLIEGSVPPELVQKYVALGLREKADAIIGAFAEWQGATYIISDNRHFLEELQSKAFEVMTADEFLQRYYRLITPMERKSL
jgi:predicted nucleic acid-binding protein